MWSLSTPPLFAALAPAERVLVAGAGGGFDVYAGLPLALALKAQGKHVDLASLTFSHLAYVQEDRWVGPGVARIDVGTDGSNTYFPERSLAKWLATQGRDIEVFAIDRRGVRPVSAAYRALHERLGFDALVLVDGGTDILMHGDEAGLGTPVEDVTSLLAAARLDVTTKLVVSVGFGVDAFHGVCHAHALENLAELARAGAYLGALSIPRDSPEAIAYLDAVDHARLRTEHRPSIVNGQIAASVRGEFGDVPVSKNVSGGLFVNPLMAILFTVELDALAGRLLYADAIAGTEEAGEVTLAIERFRATHPARPYRSIPH